ncbi:hypothetical protein HXY32_00345 [Candidatus Bathyarchaeota archaeon]|nr:hypothetical protein [Candidatus Bathyarchaeota archaeon]
MSHNAEKTKKIIAFKQKLEKRAEELRSELKELQATLEAVNAILLEKGFKRAEIGKASAETETWPPREESAAEPFAMQVPTENENVVPLTTVSGELLAILYVGEDSLQVLPAEDKNFDVNTPPFTSFLVERVLAKMKEKDNELARTGQIPPEKIFSYTITREGDIIREIIIRNVDQTRLRELKSSIRWTLEKMHEKLKSQS